MNKHMKDYVESIDSPNTQKVIRHVFKKIESYNIEKYSLIQLEQLIINIKPRSPKEIITIVYVLSTYAKWLYEQNIIKDNNLYEMLQSLDKKLLWKKCKPMAKSKFISYEQYQRIIKDIATYEEYNALYYELLFACIYSGIYSDDLSVLKNLRSSNIGDDGIVVLQKDNGHSYKFKISERLASDLKQLANISIWQRPNRFGICNVEMRGVYSDSVFKIENRSSASSDSFKFSYYARLRKISKEYIEYSLLPLQLYTSGLMHRIKVELDKNGIPLEEAFALNNRNKTAHMIIEKELIRCNSGIELGNFRELVKGHIEIFRD